MSTHATTQDAMNTVAASVDITRARSTLGAPFSTPFVASSTCVKPIVWSIAGSDSGGGAGLQADLKVLHAFGVHACTAVAALTAQNSVAVAQVMPVSVAHLDAQLAALAQDMPPHAIKTGLLGSADNVRVVCQWVDKLRAQGLPVPLVVDPVLGATTGASFVDEALVQAYVKELLPRATLVTPNQAEAVRLGLVVGRVYMPGQPSVVITGGDVLAGQHAPGSAAESAPVVHSAGSASDWLCSPQGTGWLSLARVDTPHHHGTGCTFASTAAAALASGYCVADAAVLAKMATTQALRHAYAAGQGAGPVNPQTDFALHLGNLPAFRTQRGVGSAQAGAGAANSATGQGTALPALANPALGVYAVVDSAQWVRRVLQAGIRTVQLRIKDPSDPTLSGQIADAVAAARATPSAQLFINDHWALALEHGAYGVHVGQEDLDQVDLAALRRAGVRLGLSTHSYWEVARAYALRPSYIACGPIFATQSKDMPWVPQGLDNLRYWAGLLDVPVVGIAGIDTSNMAAVAATGAASGAVITAITKAADPEAACQQLMAEFERGQAKA
jgi:hydroxymethylpyrimidine kinase / phosphomethylpyrimidine kinase / thiamine-phosphate diphosphorylase